MSVFHENISRKYPQQCKSMNKIFLFHSHAKTQLSRLAIFDRNDKENSTFDLFSGACLLLGMNKYIFFTNIKAFKFV